MTDTANPEGTDLDIGNLPTARIDVTTWEFHPEPPSTVDAELDRKTDRLFTVARVLQWSTVVLGVAVVLPGMVGLVTLPVLALIVGGLAVAAAIVVGLWHQQLRKRTGIPVIPVLADSLEPFAAMLRETQAAYELVLEEDPDAAGVEDAQNLRDMQSVAREGLAAQHTMTRVLARRLIMHCELAAQADRRGWTRRRNRQVRAIADLVVQVARPRGEHTGDAAAADHDASSTH